MTPEEMQRLIAQYQAQNTAPPSAPPQPAYPPTHPATVPYPASPHAPAYVPPSPHAPAYVVPNSHAGTAAPSIPSPSLAGAKDGNTLGRYLPVGTYRLAITGSKIFLHNVDRMPRFAVEFVVLESSNPEVRVGDASYSWVESYHDQYGYGPNAIKGYVCSILRKKDPSIGDPAVNWQDSYTDRVVAGLDVGVEMTAMVVPRVSQGRGKTPAGTVLGRFYWAD